jgi:hypothetical protein
VRLQPDGRADIGIDARVDDRQRRIRLEHVHALMRGVVRVAFGLCDPIVVVERLRHGAFGGHLALPLPSHRQRGNDQRHDDAAGPRQAAVAYQRRELLGGDCPDHRQPCMCWR